MRKKINKVIKYKCFCLIFVVNVKSRGFDIVYFSVNILISCLVEIMEMFKLFVIWGRIFFIINLINLIVIVEVVSRKILKFIINFFIEMFW